MFALPVDPRLLRDAFLPDDFALEIGFDDLAVRDIG